MNQQQQKTVHRPDAAPVAATPEVDESLRIRADFQSVQQQSDAFARARRIIEQKQLISPTEEQAITLLGHTVQVSGE